MKEHREELQKYITGIIQNRGHKLLSISVMPDHAHILIGLAPSTSLSGLIRDVKAASGKFIKEQKWIRSRFNWQEGYGAFSYSQSGIGKVIKYINEQEEHHKKKTFHEEYIKLLDKFEIEYDEKYLFDRIE